MFNFSKKEFKVITITPLNLPFNLLKKFDNSLISSIYFSDGNFDITKKLIDDLNSEKIYLVYFKNNTKFLRVKIHLLYYCADYDQILFDVMMKKANSKNFCCKEKITKQNLLDFNFENFSKRTNSDLIEEYKKIENIWLEDKSKAIKTKSDFKIISKYKKINLNEEYYFDKGFFYKLLPITPFINLVDFDVFQNVLIDMTHGLLNCILKPMIIHVLKLLDEEEMKKVIKNFETINEIIGKEVPELKCLTKVKFCFDIYFFEEYISLSYQLPFLFKNTHFEQLLNNLSLVCSLSLRKLFYFENEILKKNYQKLINLSIEYFNKEKETNPMMNHAYSHLFFHIIKQCADFGPSKFNF
jgi:hypothetical protein